jgi:hypothetical protein
MAYGPILPKTLPRHWRGRLPPEVTPGKAFLIGFLVALGLGIAVTLATNLIIDPFARYDLVSIPRLNALRTQAGTDPRLSKPAIMCRDRPEAVVIGTSRVALAIDPVHPGWGSAAGHVYNFGIPGMGLEEVALTFRHAVFASRRLRLALVGLDFLMFNANREVLAPQTENIAFDRQRLVLSETDSCFGSFFHDFDSWLGARGLAQSLITISQQVPETERNKPNKIATLLSLYRRDGLLDNAKVFEDLARTGGYRSLFGPGGQERYYTSVVWLPPPDRNYCFSRDELNTFEIFKDLIRFARQAGIDLRLFIDPVHARLLLAMRYARLWPLYEEWKRRLVQILAEESRESGKPAFPLWDFSGFNAVTTETVPPAGDLETQVKWFWEPAHYKRETGDLILDRVLGHRTSARLVPDDFGILLTPENIESSLAADSQKGDDYLRREAADAALVRNVVNEATSNISPFSCRGSLGKTGVTGIHSGLLERPLQPKTESR